MSTEVAAVPAVSNVEEVIEKKEVIQPGGDAPAPAPAEAETTAATTTEEEKKPVDPREDPLGWIGTLIPVGVHKVNHQLLSWLQATAIEKPEDRAPLPGKDDSVTRGQFLNFLKDGVLLAKFSNAVAPGSVEKVYEGEEAKNADNQKANIESFIKVIKEKFGLSDEQVFKVEDLIQKGKAGYPAVFNTVFQIASSAQEKLATAGIDVEKVIEIAQSAVKINLIQTILNFFKKARPTLKEKEATEEQPAAATTTANGGASKTEDNKPEAANGAASESAPAVAAN